MDTPLTQGERPKSPETVLSAPTVTITRVAAKPVDVNQQRLALFLAQEQAVTRWFAQDRSTAQPFYVASKKSQFIETERLQVASYLNARDATDLHQLQLLFDNLHVVDDMLMAILSKLPRQRPVGWYLLSQGQNLLNLPTTSPVRSIEEARQIEKSVAATVLQFFGVACFSQDKGYFIGHILGYLFCCYYFAHLGINYGVTALKEIIAPNYRYQAVSVPQLVRLLQTVDEPLKVQVYQLAVYCAQISEYAIDKRIERMLITEVNSFNKQDLRDELSQQLLYDQLEQASLFQPIKALK